MQTIKIQAANTAHLEIIKRALQKMDLPWYTRMGSPDLIEVQINDYMDAYYLGANVVAEQYDLFKTSLTR